MKSIQKQLKLEKVSQFPFLHGKLITCMLVVTETIDINNKTVVGTEIAIIVKIDIIRL